MSYGVLSKYRTELMGVAILWVMLFHAYGLDLGHWVINWVRSIGFGGVDIFILLSAMGLAMSLGRREQDYTSFMARRAGRVLPAYYIVMVPYTIFLILHSGAPWSALIWNCLLLYYWVQPDGSFNWYVACIMTFYAITPACFRFLRRSRRRELLTAAVVLGGLMICQVLMHDSFWDKLDIMYRVPVFFLGLLLGFYMLEDRKIGLRDTVFWCCWAGLGVIYLLARRQGIKAVSLPLCHLFLFTTVPMCLVLCWLFQCLPLGLLRRGLRFLGSYSLEIYLLNVSLFAEVDLLRQLLPLGLRRYYLLAFLANIALAVPLHYLAEGLHRAIGPTRRKAV